MTLSTNRNIQCILLVLVLSLLAPNGLLADGICASISAESVFFSENIVMLSGQMPDGVPLGAEVYLAPEEENPGDISLHVEVDFFPQDGPTQDMVYEAALTFSFLEGDSLQRIVFDELLDHQTFGLGDFILRYYLSREVDGSLEISEEVLAYFTVKDNFLSKTPQNIEGDALFNQSFGPSVGGDFKYGYHFYLPEDTEYRVDSVQFGYSKGGGESLEGTEVKISLYKWEDDGNGAVADSEITEVAFYRHTYTDEENNQQLWGSLTDATSGASGLDLPGDSHYLLMGEYEGEEPLYLNVLTEINYDAYTNYARELSLSDNNLRRFADVLSIGGDWYMYGFNTPSVPAMLLAISPATGEPPQQNVNAAFGEDDLFFGSNYIQPAGQAGSGMALGSLVYNIGGETPESANLTSTIDFLADQGSAVETIYSGSILVDFNIADTLIVYSDDDQFFVYDDYGPGSYLINYSLETEPLDVLPFNNTASSQFEVREGFLSKVPLDELGLPVSDGSFGPVDGGEFEYGIHFYLAQGASVQLDSVNFGWLAGEGTDISSETVGLKLYEWQDSGDAVIDPLELNTIGYSEYSFSTGDENSERHWGQMRDLDENPGVRLSDNAHYVLMAVYEGSGDMFLNCSTELNYDPFSTMSLFLVESTGNPNLIRLSDVLYLNEQIYNRGFSGNICPSLLLALGPAQSAIGVENPKLVQPVLKILANPVERYLYFELETDNWQGWSLQVSSISGQAIYQTKLKGKTDALDCNSLSPGQYILTLLKDSYQVSQTFIKQL